MKKIIILFAIGLLSVFSLQAKGVWGFALAYPGEYDGDDGFKSRYSYLAFGDSIFIFNGKWLKKTPPTVTSFYFIRYTLDGGKTWSKLAEFEDRGRFLGEDMYLWDLELSNLNFFPPNTLQFTHYSTADVFKTTDWGKSWSKTSTGVIKDRVQSYGVRTFVLDSLRQIFNGYAHDDHKFIYGYTKKSYMTYDGWKTFEKVNLPSRSMNVQMVGDSSLVSMCWPYIHYSSDRGKTWDSTVVPGNKEDSLVYTHGGDFSIIPGSKTILFTGGRVYKKPNFGNIMAWKSSDAGKTWRVVLDTKDSLFTGGGKMSFNDKGQGCIVGYASSADTKGLNTSVTYVSSDYGETWEKTYFDDTFKGHDFANSCATGSLKNMWALIGDYFYKYKPEPSAVNDGEEDVLTSSGAVYPNPVRRGGTVYLQLQESINPGSKVGIYSILGELIDEYIPNESTNLLSYKPDEKLVKGNYYFVIETPEGNITKSFIVE